MERILTYYVVTDTTVFNAIGKHLDPDLMENDLCKKMVEVSLWISKQKLAGKALASRVLLEQRFSELYVEGKVRKPVVEEIKAFFDSYEGRTNLTAPKKGIPVVKDVLKRIKRHQVLMDEVNSAGTNLDTTQISRQFASINQIGESKSVHFLTMDSAVEALQMQQDQSNLLVGINELDAHMRHAHETLAVVCAPTGGGKSTFLNQVATACVLQKLNVMLITLELTAEQAMKKFLAALTYRDMETLQPGSKALSDAARELKALQESGKLGKIVCSYLEPDKFTVDDIAQTYEEAEITELGGKFDLLIIDWDAKIKTSTTSDYKGMGDVYTFFDNFSKEKHIWTWIASQATRQDKKSRSGDVYLDVNDIADSMNKSRNVSVMVTLNPRSDGSLVFNLCKNRWGATALLTDSPVDTLMHQGLICRRAAYIDVPLELDDNVDDFGGM